MAFAASTQSAHKRRSMAPSSYPSMPTRHSTFSFRFACRRGSAGLAVQKDDRLLPHVDPLRRVEPAVVCEGAHEELDPVDVTLADAEDGQVAVRLVKVPRRRVRPGGGEEVDRRELVALHRQDALLVRGAAVVRPVVAEAHAEPRRRVLRRGGRSSPARAALSRAPASHRGNACGRTGQIRHAFPLENVSTTSGARGRDVGRTRPPRCAL